jgi:hypothetical protein
VSANRGQRALVVVFLVMALIIVCLMLFGGLRDRNPLHGMAYPTGDSTSIAT